MIRALIVDDERLARSELLRLLKAHESIEVVGECADAVAAKAAIECLAPDLIFLDVQMPGASGFDLLGWLDDVPQVIFTTAFDSYALKAFEVNALDFLQKPIHADRLAVALARAQEQFARTQARPGRLERIFIKDGARCWFVALRDILLFESEGNYTRLYFDGERPLMLRSLNQLEERLEAGRFFRANRRQIVNLDFVARIDTAPSGALVLVLGGGLRVELSRRRAAQFRSRNSR